MINTHEKLLKRSSIGNIDTGLKWQWEVLHCNMWTELSVIHTMFKLLKKHVSVKIDLSSKICEPSSLNFLHQAVQHLKMRQKCLQPQINLLKALVIHQNHHSLGLLQYLGWFFISPCQRQCELLPLLSVRRQSSFNFSHFNLLLWNPSAKCTETW